MTKMIELTVLHIDTTITHTETTEADLLKTVQAIVGGWVEQVHMPHRTDVVMLVNEEGLLLGMADNYLANRVAQREGLVGNAVLVPAGEWV